MTEKQIQIASTPSRHEKNVEAIVQSLATLQEDMQKSADRHKRILEILAGAVSLLLIGLLAAWMLYQLSE